MHKGLFYAALLCVYAAFFSVESFHNFEGHHLTSSYGFRLNKRFHPEMIPPCPIVSPEVPQRYVTLVRLGSPGDRPLPDIAIIHYSLRGPPAAA